MATRPTNSREWAESAAAEDVDEPTVERPTGYLKGQSLPHDQLNWLLRELFRWADWFDEKFQNATGLIDFFSGIDFGDNINIFKPQDDSAEWEVRFSHSGSGEARWCANILEASVRVVTPVIHPSGSIVEIQDSAGSVGGLLLRYIKASGVGLYPELIDLQDSAGNAGEGGAVLDILRAGTGLLVDFQPSGGSGNSGEGGALLDILRPGTSDEVDVQNSAGNSGMGALRALNTARAWGHLDGVGVSNGNPLTVGDSFGIDTTNKVGTGVYSIDFDRSETGGALVAAATLEASGGANENTDPSGGRLSI